MLVCLHLIYIKDCRFNVHVEAELTSGIFLCSVLLYFAEKGSLTVHKASLIWKNSLASKPYPPRAGSLGTRRHIQLLAWVLRM